MNKLFIRTIYGVTDIVFNVGQNGEVKTHYDPLTDRVYAYGSSANVKRNIKEYFSMKSGIQTPQTEFKKNASVTNKTITVNEDGKGEQSGVSIMIDIENPICPIFGAWNSDCNADGKYTKAALKACFNVSDMVPVHPLLAHLNKEEVGVFVGDANSKVTLGITNGELKGTTIKSPKEASELVGCTIEEAKKAFENQRPMNLYKDKRTATGLYQVTYAIDLDTFGKIKCSSCSIPSETKEKLLNEKQWHEVTIDGEIYLSPSCEELCELWDKFVKALIYWDFSSNNSLHGNVKEALRYTYSFNANKLNDCNTARIYTVIDKKTGEEKLKAQLLLIDDCKEVTSFNHVALGKYYDIKDINCSVDASEQAVEELQRIGKSHFQAPLEGKKFRVMLIKE